MAEKILPQNVGSILDRCIYSVSQLETLLFLRRFRERPWTAQQVANELHTNAPAARQMLNELAADGLLSRKSVEQSEQFTYELNGSVEADVGALATAYQHMRMRVVDRIYRKPRSGGSFRELADSFLIREDEQ